MSKAVAPDYEFDKEAFTALLIKAKAGKKQIDFADEIGVSKSYLCKYLNGRFDKPPIPSTLKKIADHCDNRISFSELLEAAGYDSEKYCSPSSQYNFFDFDGNIRSYSLSLITSAMDCYMDSATGRNKMELILAGDDYRGEVSLKTEKHDSWIFIAFMPQENDPESTASEKLFNGLTISLNKYTNAARTVFTIVTDNESTYQLLGQMTFPALTPLCSIILVDTGNNSLLKYSFLQTAFPLDEDVKKMYSL